MSNSGFIRIARTALGLAALAFAAIMQNLAQAQSVQGVSDSEIVIGTITDLSGPVVSVGAPQRDGMILAVEDINAAGGIHGRKLRVLVEDSGYDPKKAVLAAQKLLTQDKVFALVGTLGSAMLLATQPMALARNVPVLFPMVSTEAAFTPHSPLKFALLAMGADAMRVGVKHFHDKLGKRRFGIIYQDDETGQTYLRAAEEQLKAHGLALVERVSHKRGETNFSSQVARLKAANLDALLLGVLPREGAAVAIEARTQSWKVDMMLSNATVAAVPTLAGAAAEGMYGTNAFVGQSQDPSPAYSAVLERFKDRFKREPQDGVNFGYTSVMLFAEGAKNAGRDLTQATLAQGLEKVRSFKTVFDMSPVTYTANYHGPARGAFVLQLQGGKWKVVDGPVQY